MLKKPFSFEIPVSNLATINSKITTTLIGNIKVDGVVALMHDRAHEIDYTSIKWNDADILMLLNNYPGADKLMDNIHDAAMNHVANTFDAELNEDKMHEESSDRILVCINQQN